MAESIAVSLEWPGALDADFPMEFFAGLWHHSAELQVRVKLPHTGSPLTTVTGRNWFLLGSAHPSLGRSLVHARRSPEGEQQAVAFRGYLLDPPVASWSPSDRMFAACVDEPPRLWNGVFALARILEGGRRLQLITDAFGIAPLYYRIFQGLVMFSTHPAWLACTGDRPDWIAARALLQAGFVTGDRSHMEGVHRAPAAHRLCAQGQRLEPHRWWDYSEVADGSEPLDEAGLSRLEEAFQSAISKCLRLPAAEYVLLLSSGYDSRRILAALVSRRLPFRALTVRVFWKGKWDLDAPWAAAMAREHGFSHRVVELPSPEEYARLDRLRRSLLDVETVQHTWGLTLAPHLGPLQALVFDGLGGDVLGETGFEIESVCSADEPTKLRLIAELLFPQNFERVLRPGFWPALENLREDLISWLQALPEGSNRADLAFLLLRTRRSTALFGQQLLPCGNVTVCPYLELEYLREAFRYRNLEKLQRSLQALALERFWPAFYKYPGTRRMPEGLNPLPASVGQAFTLATLRSLRQETGGLLRSGTWRLLSPRSLALAAAAGFHSGLALRCAWWLNPMLSVVARHRSVRPAWRFLESGPSWPH